MGTWEVIHSALQMPLSLRWACGAEALYYSLIIDKQASRPDPQTKLVQEIENMLYFQWIKMCYNKHYTPAGHNIFSYFIPQQRCKLASGNQFTAMLTLSLHAFSLETYNQRDACSKSQVISHESPFPKRTISQSADTELAIFPGNKPWCTWKHWFSCIPFNKCSL